MMIDPSGFEPIDENFANALMNTFNNGKLIAHGELSYMVIY